MEFCNNVAKLFDGNPFVIGALTVLERLDNPRPLTLLHIVYTVPERECRFDGILIVKF